LTLCEAVTNGGRIRSRRSRRPATPASVYRPFMPFASPCFFGPGSETAPISVGAYMGKLPSRSAFPRTWPLPSLVTGGGSFRCRLIVNGERRSKTSKPAVPTGARGSTHGLRGCRRPFSVACQAFALATGGTLLAPPAVPIAPAAALAIQAFAYANFASGPQCEIASIFM
jgi:hypothetical protein